MFNRVASFILGCVRTFELRRNWNFISNDDWTSGALAIRCVILFMWQNLKVIQLQQILILLIFIHLTCRPVAVSSWHHQSYITYTLLKISGSIPCIYCTLSPFRCVINVLPSRRVCDEPAWSRINVHRDSQNVNDRSEYCSKMPIVLGLFPYGSFNI